MKLTRPLRSKQSFIRKAMVGIINKNCTDDFNSLRNRAHIARHLNTFLSYMVKRRFPTRIEDYCVVCDRSNNPEDGVACLVVDVMVKLGQDDEFIHFPFVMNFDHKIKVERESAFNRAMKGI